MGIRDIDPGFLNDRSLLGEHRELHAVFVIITEGKKGYSKHPETMRWRGCLGALSLRHGLIKEEMALRGFRHLSPVDKVTSHRSWPSLFIDPPHRQYEILAGKYKDKMPGRIPLPRNAQELWANHKYSIMARSQALYRETGQIIASGEMTKDDLSLLLVRELRKRPEAGDLRNVLLHMWGYISGYSEKKPEEMEDYEMLSEIREKSGSRGVEYLLRSTALGELGLWCGK